MGILHFTFTHTFRLLYFFIALKVQCHSCTCYKLKNFYSKTRKILKTYVLYKKQHKALVYKLKLPNSLPLESQLTKINIQ